MNMITFACWASHKADSPGTVADEFFIEGLDTFACEVTRSVSSIVHEGLHGSNGDVW